ncbi:MAG: hypothetical protein J2O48_04915 [Solirubrobacterales bacterium]|nr:hypothetical protein [Solirubrobacterales bacterium]
MAGSLERRTPRSVREQRAFRSVQVGALSGTGFVVTTVLWIAGVISGLIPVLLLVLTLLCVAGFANATGLGKRR